MKRHILFFFLSLLQLMEAVPAFAQKKAGDTRMFRIYEDNDFINIWGRGTDEAYTNGTRFDLFYYRKKTPQSFIYRLMPRAGKNSVNTFGWGIMQMMVTPRDISRPDPDPYDYRYAGALFAIHSLHSSNEAKKLNIQSEWVVGIMGPAAMAEQTQTYVHRLIRYQRPMGWDHQLPNDLLLNYNFTIEKQLAHYARFMEIIGGGQLSTGTMINGGAIYSLIRVGKMTPYFRGFISQYTTSKKDKHRIQLYFVIKPIAEFVMDNALLQGGFFNEKSPLNKVNPDKVPVIDTRKVVTRIDFGLVASAGNVSLSFIQKSSSPVVKGLPGHQVGNISLYIGW